MDDKDERFLRRAIELAEAAVASGNPPYGSLLVGPDGEILLEDHNTTVTDADVSHHPELKLAVWAARELDPEIAAATTMYTSCQPCGMCTGAIERSGLRRVVYALATEQLVDLQGPAAPARVSPVLEGPALLEEARQPIEDYYR